MREKQKHGRNSSANWLEKLFSPRVGKRVTAKQSGEFRKLFFQGIGANWSVAKIRAICRNERQAHLNQDAHAVKAPISAKATRGGVRTARNPRTASARISHRRARSDLRATGAIAGKVAGGLATPQEYKGERVARIAEHLHNIELKERGDYLDKDIWLREKAFSEAHRDVPDELGFYQKWFNYGHVKRAA